jgi:hypothetical protein
MAHNEKYLLREERFKTRPPATGTEFCSKVELISELNNIPFAGANVDECTSKVYIKFRSFNNFSMSLLLLFFGSLTIL